MAQAIGIKLELEKGSLKRHKQIGIAGSIGEKVTSSFVNDKKRDIITSLQSDLRVESVPYIEISQDGGTTTINAIVRLKDIGDVPLPLTIKNSA